MTAESVNPRRGLWAAGIVGFWMLVAAGAVFTGAGIWVRRTFGVISIDQLLSNINGGGDGAGGDALVAGAVAAILVVPVAITLALAVVVETFRRGLRSKDWFTTLRTRLFRGISIALAVVLPLSGAVVFGDTIGAADYVQASMREKALGTTLADFYTAPKIESTTGTGGSAVSVGSRNDESVTATNGAAGTKNLVLIYLESIEDTFADDTVFEENMLAPVQEATSGWAAVPRLQQYEGGGWTMAGIVSTQCGIPLRTASSNADNNDLNVLGDKGHEVEQFLPGADCLGDVLKQKGYRNVFLGGANADFAGKGTFLSGHGYDEVDDLKVWASEGETETRDDWGLSDRRLFERAKEKVTQLHDAGQPFNLTILTLDTHEEPHVYDYCDVTTKKAMTSITLCSMEQVAEFVDFMENEGYLNDTTVVLMGDHRKMNVEGGSFWDELKDRDDRTIFNRVWAPGGAQFARDEIDQLSMYPTLLELVGLNLKDHRAGIGVSALVKAKDVPAGSILDLDSSEYLDVVNSRSMDFYAKMWAHGSQVTAAG
ncbi:sulfatase-like hydrolase/transferase [Leucobacter coleopterorum]|uniref:Sulfatase-like hydrolase/transferase n=1 Tax=Leucobacter coleopterorum TaxID=2714933 RepID=A0ABX6JYC9_9MICO|nr:sulfatase-like hydrolase/transferase [Leucobacter coleopterorum]QIM19329.1 sulfatase-like hydrolase/transferase [Leucobacter coleopterorum]